MKDIALLRDRERRRVEKSPALGRIRTHKRSSLKILRYLHLDKEQRLKEHSFKMGITHQFIRAYLRQFSTLIPLNVT